MEKEKKVRFTDYSDEPSLKFGEYKADKEENTMFVGADNFPIPNIAPNAIPNKVGGTFSRVVSDNE